MSIAAEHEIVTIPRADALQVYTTPGAIDLYLGKIKTEVDGFLALGMTVETDKGRKAIRSMAFRMARTRAALENIGKALADEVKAIPKKVDATRRLVRDTLEAWEDDVRRPLTKWEDTEKARVEDHEREIDCMVEAPGWGIHETSEEVRRRLDCLRNWPPRDWQEFAERAQQTLAAEIERTERLLAAAEKREAEAAELSKLRAAEEERLAREREEQARREAEERERRIADEAAAAERVRAEQERQRVEREKLEAIERAARAEREKAEVEERARLAAEKAERDRVAAVEAAAADERRRAAEEKARQEREAAEREANKRHRAAVNNAAVDAFVAGGIERETAVAVVTLIAKRTIPRIVISY